MRAGWATSMSPNALITCTKYKDVIKQQLLHLQL